MNSIQLNSGQTMPLIGFGTYAVHGQGSEETMLRAVELGYRLFDTATVPAHAPLVRVG